MHQSRRSRFQPSNARHNNRIAPMGSYCRLCYSNGEPEQFYRSHTLKDRENRVTCPVLKNYVCPHCHQKGIHTASYCDKLDRCIKRNEAQTSSKPIAPLLRTKLQANGRRKPVKNNSMSSDSSFGSIGTWSPTDAMIPASVPTSSSTPARTSRDQGHSNEFKVRFAPETIALLAQRIILKLILNYNV